MRPHGQTKLGFSPLPVVEAKRLKNWLRFRSDFRQSIPLSAMEWHSLTCFTT